MTDVIAGDAMLIAKSKYKMEINDKPLMASEIIGALGQPKRAIAHFKSGSIAEGKARETQSMLVNAQKFKVSNKLIDHAGESINV